MFHPTPQMRRDSLLCLDGKWSVSVGGAPAVPINVPYPPESPLSGVAAPPSGNTILRYETTFSVPDGFTNGRVLLHFGAVDQEAEVWLNGHRLGAHSGGYDPFSFDVTPPCRKRTV